MAEQWVTGTVRLKIAGQPREMEMTVPATPVKPQRMLPILQMVTNSLVNESVSESAADGEPISCKAGCGACCRQPVPITEVEMYHLAELVESMPKPRQSRIRKRFADAVQHFDRIDWFDRLDAAVHDRPGEEDGSGAKRRVELALEYFREGIACPFLEDESCSIHPDRPLACREYVVTSPAENCSHPTGETVRLLKLPAKPSLSLAGLGKRSTNGNPSMMIMVRALDLAQQFPEDYPKRTGPEWMQDFFDRMGGGGSASSPRQGP